GPGHYAIGRGYIALSQVDKAKDELEAAWAKNYHEPQAAYALGYVLGQLYNSRLQEIKGIADKERRDEAQRKAEEQLKAPALNYLELGRQAVGESSEYAEALVAYYDGRREEALKKAEAAQNKLPWLFEAKTLEASIYSEIADEKFDGGDYGGARRDFETAVS